MSAPTLARSVAPAAADTAPLRVVIYTRISNDKEGRELGVSRQRADADEYITRHGYVLATGAPRLDRG